jgi:hypothetical protein
MTATSVQNRREQARSRMLKSGKIQVGKVSIPCTVRNLSDTGACLQVQSAYGIPGTFEFKLDDKPARACKVAWLDGCKIGVQFV